LTSPLSKHIILTIFNARGTAVQSHSVPQEWPPNSSGKQYAVYVSDSPRGWQAGKGILMGIGELNKFKAGKGKFFKFK
jgi:hypothetical protein